MAGQGRDEILSRLNAEKFYSAYGIQLKRSGASLVAKCPFHEDSNPSFSVFGNESRFKCHACGAEGSPIDLVMRIDNIEYKEAIAKVASIAGVELKPDKGKAVRRPTIPSTKVKQWHERLLRDPVWLKFIHESIRWTDATIAEFQIGLEHGDGKQHDRITIPIRDSSGRIVNVRKYDPRSGGKNKMISHWETNPEDPKKPFTYGESRLWPEKLPEGSDIVLLCEGEKDCITAHQNGFVSITGTAGCSTWKGEWNEVFAGRDVVIAYDNDEEGQKAARTKVAPSLLSTAKSVRILVWPDGCADKYDITDWFASDGRSAEELHDLISISPQYEASGRDAERPDAVSVSLAHSTAKEYTGKPIRFRAVIAGKDAEPYTIPGEVDAECDRHWGKACASCPMELKGRASLKLTHWDRSVLGMIRVRDEIQRHALRECLGVPTKCPKITFNVRVWENIEELRIVPEINGKLQTTDAGRQEDLPMQSGAHDTRTVYSFSHGLDANTVYEMEGVTFPDVADQKATVLVGKTEAVENDIGSLVVTPELCERLSIFQVQPGMTVSQKMDEIAREMEKSIRIANRRDVYHVLDLCWHSVLGFRAFGQTAPKGWVEVMLLGESGQAKTEIVKRLMGYYGCGYFLEGGNTSAVGLTAGAQKGRGDRWEISWGVMVLHDGKLVAIDEFDQMPEEQIGKLKSVRSSGMVEIEKISHGAAWARTRLAIIANPKGKRPLSDFAYGAAALIPLFSSPADIRRLDLVIGLRSGEVPKEVLNRIWPEEQSRYSQDDCHDLILWAWSRKPWQVVFTPDAQEAVAHTCMVLGEWHVDRIPLLEPADLRWKVCRMAAAAAARVFSTEDGSTLRVGSEHVSFVSGLMQRCYEAPALDFRRMGERDRSNDRRVRETWDEAVQTLSGLVPDPVRLADYLRYNDFIKPRDLEFRLGLDVPMTKSVTKTMSKYGWLDQARDGFKKRQVVNVMLLADEDDEFSRWSQPNDFQQLGSLYDADSDD